MKSIFSFLFSFILSLGIAQNATKVNLETSNIEWVGKKVTGQHNGNINLKSGDLVFYEGKLLKGIFKIDMNSITCTDLKGESSDKLVRHLKNEDFFNTKEFPEAILNFREVKQIEGSSYLIIADLTIKGITNTIEFNADVRANKASAVINVDRTMYDIRYGSTSFFDALGDKAIDDIFVIKIDLVF